MVSKSQNPVASPGAQNEMNLSQWSAAPASAAMVAFGNPECSRQSHRRQRHFSTTQRTRSSRRSSPSSTIEEASVDNARQIAHRFADEIILRLGGVAGIAETKIFYVKKEGAGKEIWMMDYDGANQHALTHLGGIAIGPRCLTSTTRASPSPRWTRPVSRSRCSRCY